MTISTRLRAISLFSAAARLQFKIAVILVSALVTFARPAQAATTIERGGDISEYAIEQQLGTVFYDSNGNPLADPLQLCQDNGWTVARIRLFVNPPMTGVEVNTLSYAVAEAQDAVAHGMKILLDIHYSDNWDSHSYHNVPAAWKSQSYSQLQTTIKNYTINVMNAFQSAGALPAYVQIGNEVGDGLCFPIGGPISFKNGTPGPSKKWSQFIGLVKAAIAGVKAVSPTTKIMIHISGGSYASWCTEYFDAFNAQGVNYDLIGLSYYPYLIAPTTDLSDITATLNALHNRYTGKKLWITEFSYDWGYGVSNNVVYPNTPMGQYDVTRDLCNLVASYSDGGGVCYWGVFYVSNPNLTYNWGSKTLFDYPSHYAEPAFNALSPNPTY